VAVANGGVIDAVVALGVGGGDVAVNGGSTANGSGVGENVGVTGAISVLGDTIGWGVGEGTGRNWGSSHSWIRSSSTNARVKASTRQRNCLRFGMVDDDLGSSAKSVCPMRQVTVTGPVTVTFQSHFKSILRQNELGAFRMSFARTFREASAPWTWTAQTASRKVSNRD